jgi:Low-density lipoprotein receptor domain class A/Calcium-binding EGF domain
MFCDGHNDCPDGYDELNCNTNSTMSCDIDEFQCTSESKCISLKKKCDKKADCKQAEDEKDCFKCDRGYFKCNNNQCIDESIVCNGRDDCGDDSDENECGGNSTIAICSPGTFKCSDGKCLAFAKVCDGHSDCADDEGPVCDEACIGKPCDQKCIKTPKGAKCECNDGYELKGIGDKKCVDIDECKTRDPCAQICQNLEGSYMCSCFDGYVIGLDGHQCRALGDSERFFYIVDDEIRKLDRQSISRVVDANLPLKNVAFDVARNRIIFSSSAADGIVSATIDTENMNFKYLNKIPITECFAYDWISQNVYVVHQNGAQWAISLCNTQNEKCAVLKNLEHNTVAAKIMSIDVDPVNKFVFYVKRVRGDWRSIQVTSIMRMKLDGSDEKEMHSDTDISTMALDIDKKLIYFTEKRSQSLQSISYEGKDKETLVYQSYMFKNPTSMSLFENHAYFFDESNFQIRECKLYGDKTCKSFKNEIANAKGLVVTHKSNQRMIPNICEQHNCDEICVAADLSAKCLCSNGMRPAVVCDKRVSFF